MPFATCVALGILHSNGKIEDDVHVRLRNGTASVAEAIAFEELLVEHQMAVLANAERRKQKRAIKAVEQDVPLMPAINH
jgi:hypothetical protein